MWEEAGNVFLMSTVMEDQNKTNTFVKVEVGAVMCLTQGQREAKGKWLTERLLLVLDVVLFNCFVFDFFFLKSLKEKKKQWLKVSDISNDNFNYVMNYCWQAAENKAPHNDIVF